MDKFAPLLLACSEFAQTHFSMGWHPVNNRYMKALHMSANAQIIVDFPPGKFALYCSCHLFIPFATLI